MEREGGIGEEFTIRGSMSVEVSDLDLDGDILGEGEYDGEKGWKFRQEREGTALVSNEP